MTPGRACPRTQRSAAGGAAPAALRFPSLSPPLCHNLTLLEFHLRKVPTEVLLGHVDTYTGHQASKQEVCGSKLPATRRGQRRCDERGEAGDRTSQLVAYSDAAVAIPRTEKLGEEGRLDGVVEVVRDVDNEEESQEYQDH